MNIKHSGRVRAFSFFPQGNEFFVLEENLFFVRQCTASRYNDFTKCQLLVNEFFF